VAIDLGTANTAVFVRGEGVVLFEPSVIAFDEQTGEVLAVGHEARRMIGRTPTRIRATRPLRQGVIADFAVTEQMLRRFLGTAIGRRARPRLILCVPSGLTQVERNAVEEATYAAGARAVYLIEEPMAAAIGAELPVAEPAGSMIVDVGGGTTEVAVIALGGMVVWQSLRVGGFAIDDAIVAHVREEHGLLIGEERAEQLKIELGSAFHLGARKSQDAAEVAGRELVSGQLARATVNAHDLGRAIDAPVARIVEAVIGTLEQTPPELAADIIERGVVLAGGGVLLRRFPDRLRQQTQLPVHLADDPIMCVAEGAGRSLDELDTIARAFRPTHRKGTLQKAATLRIHRG
jgi:rod shape-determining protein MreB